MSTSIIAPYQQIINIKKRKTLSLKIAAGIEHEISAGLAPFFGILDLSRDKLCISEIKNKLEKLKKCGNTLEWARQNGKTVLHNADFCRQPDNCPICAKRLQSQRIKRFHEPVKLAAVSFPYKYLVTWTVKDNSSLRTALNELTEGLKRFRLKGQRRDRGRSRGEWGKVAAGMISMEIKKGAGSGLWHPHFHGLLFCTEKLDYRSIETGMYNGHAVRMSKISREWNEATNGKSIGIDVRPIFVKKIKKNGKIEFKTVWQQSLEIFKYNSKINGLYSGKVDVSEIITVMCAGYNRRKFSTYGAFRDKESKFYAGPLEPYISELEAGEKPVYYAQRWTGEDYSRFKKIRRPLLTAKGRTDYKTAIARILGEHKRKKYQILNSRRHDSDLFEVSKNLERNYESQRENIRNLRNFWFTEEPNIYLTKLRKSNYFKRKYQKYFEFIRGIPLPDLPPAWRDFALRNRLLFA